ncbi:MAG: group III truncated hemoglobin [Bacteroidetes bacterium]|nr:group III truncated hemoglobin [Bacteroidota bacterium]
MADINTVEDIQLLVNSFYDKVRKDNIIGYIFDSIIGEDWSHHLPIMYQFWDTVLFANAGYTGNPMKKHIDIDNKMPLKEEHYEQWLRLWFETIDELFAGEIAEKAKSRAAAMMQLISMKVQMAREGKTIM